MRHTLPGLRSMVAHPILPLTRGHRAIATHSMTSTSVSIAIQHSRRLMMRIAEPPRNTPGNQDTTRRLRQLSLRIISHRRTIHRLGIHTAGTASTALTVDAHLAPISITTAHTRWPAATLLRPLWAKGIVNASCLACLSSIHTSTHDIYNMLQRSRHRKVAHGTGKLLLSTFIAFTWTYSLYFHCSFTSLRHDRTSSRHCCVH